MTGLKCHPKFSLHHAICLIAHQVVQWPYQIILSRQIRDGRQMIRNHLMLNPATF